MRFAQDGWPYCGHDGTTEACHDIASDVPQERKTEYTFANTDFYIDWCGMRCPVWENDYFADDHLILRGNGENCDAILMPSIGGIHHEQGGDSAF